MKKLGRVCACLVVLVAAALAGAQTAAYGQKVVVSPADLKGWVQTSRSGYVAPPNGGTYLVYSGFLEEGQALSTGGAEQQVPPGNPKGPGAFFLFTNIGINTPGMVTLGNDLLNGVPLKNITTLKYHDLTFADGNNPAQHCMSPTQVGPGVAPDLARSLRREERRLFELPAVDAPPLAERACEGLLRGHQHPLWSLGDPRCSGAGAVDRPGHPGWPVHLGAAQELPAQRSVAHSADCRLGQWKSVRLQSRLRGGVSSVGSEKADASPRSHFGSW